MMARLTAFGLSCVPSPAKHPRVVGSLPCSALTAVKRTRRRSPPPSCAMRARWGDLEVPLETWIRTGLGPRPYAGIIAARRLPTAAEVALIEIPPEYHNSPEARSLQRQGLLPCPWGPPPKTEP